MVLRAAKATLTVMAALLVYNVACAREVPTIAAASSLLEAAPALAQAFAASTGRRIRFAFGSSGNLTRQIRQGAPFEAFLSADSGFVRALAEQGLSTGDEACFALGQLVLFLNTESPLELGVPSGAPQDDFESVLTDPRLARLAIANPEHAPYGRAARQTLESKRLWSTLEPRLVVGESVAQAAQFAGSPAVQAGIIAYSLAIAPGLAARGRYALIPRAAHQPVKHRMVLLRGASETTRAFFDFVQSPTARAILTAHGFSPPGEDI